MTRQLSVVQFAQQCADSQLLDAAQVAELTHWQKQFARAKDLAKAMHQRKWLTAYQLQQLWEGKADSLLLEPYVIIELIGHGAMGEVFKARHRYLKRLVALKVIRQGQIGDKEAVRRFQREMEAVAQLNHPNVVQAYDAGQKGKTHFLAMEFVEGTDLKTLLRDEKRLTVARACAYVRQASLGLQHAHERGLIHRDIKPSNLLLAVKEDNIKLADLGLARLRGVDQEGRTNVTVLTVEGMTLGSLDYIAPEQTQDARLVDIRADIYSLGCSLYHLLSGRPPFFGGTTVDKIMQHRNVEPAPIETLCPDVPAALGDVLRKMLAKRREDRYATPTEIATVLKEYTTVRIPIAAPVTGGDESWADDLTAAQEAARDTSPSLGTSPTVAFVSDLPPHPFPLSPRGRGERGEEPGGAPKAEKVAAPPPPAAIPVKAPPAAIPVAAPPAEPVMTPALAQRDSGPMGGLARGAPIIAAIVAFLAVAGAAFMFFPGRQAAEDDPVNMPPEPAVVFIAKGSKSHAVPVLKLSLELPPLDSGAPLGPAALVARPAALPKVQSWSIETRGHRGQVRAVAFSPDGKLLASGGDDGAIRLRDASNGGLAAVLLGFEELTPDAASWFGISSLSWSPDGSYLAACGPDKVVRIWEVQKWQIKAGKWQRELTGCCMAKLKGHTDRVQAVAWQPGAGKVLASAGNDGAVRFWELETGKVLRQIDTAGTPVQSLAWSPDGNHIAGSGANRTLRIWNAESASVTQQLETKGTSWNIVWSPNGKMLACHGVPGSTSGAEIWDVATGKLLQGFPSIYGAAFNPGSDTLAMGTGNGIAYWKTAEANSKLEEVPTGKLASCLAWSPDDNVLACGEPEGTVRFVDVRTKQIRGSHFGHPGPTQGTTNFFWSPGGKMLATIEPDTKLRFWDTQAGTFLGTLPGAWSWVAFSPDLATIATTHTSDKAIHLWDTATRKELATLAGHETPVYGVAFSPDGMKLASCSYKDKAVFVWDLKAKAIAASLPTDKRLVQRLIWSPNGKTLAGASESSSTNWTLTYLWDIATKESQPILAVAGQLAWSPDSTRLAGSDLSLLRAPVDAKDTLVSLRSSSLWTTYAAAWLADSQLVVSLGTPRTLRFLDTTTREIKRTLLAPLQYGVFSPDGRQVASRLGRDTTLIWETETARPRLAFVPLRDEEILTVFADGRYHCTPRTEYWELICVVQTDVGQQVYPPRDFVRIFGWKKN